MMKLVVLCCVVAAAAARAPLYFSPAAIPSALFFGQGLLQQPFYNYRGPLSLAPGQPANVLAADGRPLDTLDVNLDRAAHFVAQAVDNGARRLQKRSVTRLAVVPDLLGYSAALAEGKVGIPTPGVATGIATNRVGVSAPLASFGITSPLVATPLAAGSLAVPILNGALGVSTFGAPLVRNF